MYTSELQPLSLWFWHFLLGQSSIWTHCHYQGTLHASVILPAFGGHQPYLRLWYHLCHLHHPRLKPWWFVACPGSIQVPQEYIPFKVLISEVSSRTTEEAWLTPRSIYNMKSTDTLAITGTVFWCPLIKVHTYLPTYIYICACIYEVTRRSIISQAD